jgi:hypothetical protein
MDSAQLDRRAQPDISSMRRPLVVNA